MDARFPGTTEEIKKAKGKEHRMKSAAAEKKYRGVFEKEPGSGEFGCLGFGAGNRT